MLYNKETKKNVTGAVYASVLQLIMSKNQSKCENYDLLYMMARVPIKVSTNVVLVLVLPIATILKRYHKFSEPC